ncbi:MAG: heavy metal-responsive transcriptional regulator [Acidimicrobiales bacterium]|nr:heavy metal-responsive transcriptional regulator [Acidimicrobiales bacterium]
MLIGEFSDALGVPTQTVRFYERRGLLPRPERAPNGYRLYDEVALQRGRFIRSAQAAGLTLAEIGSIIDIRSDGAAPCTHVGALLEAKLAEVRERQRQLGALEGELEHLLERSEVLDPADCDNDDVCHILHAGIGLPSPGVAGKSQP